MIDAHLHLQDERLVENAESIVETCRSVGIRRLIVNGTRPEDWPAVIELAERFPDMVQSCLGLHPWFVSEAATDWARILEEMIDHPSVIGIGEVGLDKWMRGYDLPKQKATLATQVELAEERRLPLMIHCLRAWGHLLEFLNTRNSGVRFLLHSFGGPAEMVEELTALGAYFSLSGYFFHERKRAALDVFVSHIPKERLLLETDAPDMGLPSSMRRFGGEAANHPGNLEVVYDAAAELLGVSCEGLREQVRENAERLTEVL